MIVFHHKMADKPVEFHEIVFLEIPALSLPDMDRKNPYLITSAALVIAPSYNMRLCDF